MFSTNSDSLTGELSDLLTHLEACYRKEKGIDPKISLEADPFIKWAKGYLDTNRPSEIFALDNNHGIVLTNGQRVKLSPGSSSVGAGGMANPDNSISMARTN